MNEAKPAANLPTYTNGELQRAVDELDNCTFVSPSTKRCYHTRIALWIHYCNEHCEGKTEVTDTRLAGYLEWMVSSGAAERVRKAKTHMLQVLRNQLQGVMCYWRIQINDCANVPDPRHSRVYLLKWQSMIQRYPRQRYRKAKKPDVV